VRCAVRHLAVIFIPRRCITDALFCMGKSVISMQVVGVGFGWVWVERGGRARVWGGPRSKPLSQGLRHPIISEVRFRASARARIAVSAMRHHPWCVPFRTFLSHWSSIAMQSFFFFLSNILGCFFLLREDHLTYSEGQFPVLSRRRLYTRLYVGR